MTFAKWLALASLLSAACTPYVKPMGPPVARPALAENMLVAADGVELPLKSWSPDGPPKAVILGLHGFNEYRVTGFRDPGQYWAKYGIVTYAYDQRGFGNAPDRGIWPGAPTLIADMENAAALVKARHPDLPLFLVGDSMGGAVILAGAAADAKLPVDGVVLVAPAVWGRATMPVYQSAALWFLSHTLPWLKVSGANLGYMPSDNIPMLRERFLDPLVIKETRIDAIHGLVNLMDAALAGGPAMRHPTLLQYGAHDEIIPVAPVRKMVASLPEGAAGHWRIAVYPNGYHMLLHDLKAHAPLDDVVAWVTGAAKSGAPLPSGADRPGEEP